MRSFAFQYSCEPPPFLLPVFPEFSQYLALLIFRKRLICSEKRFGAERMMVQGRDRWYGLPCFFYCWEEEIMVRANIKFEARG